MEKAHGWHYVRSKNSGRATAETNAVHNDALPTPPMSNPRPESDQTSETTPINKSFIPQLTPVSPVDHTSSASRVSLNEGGELLGLQRPEEFMGHNPGHLKPDLGYHNGHHLLDNYFFDTFLHISDDDRRAFEQVSLPLSSSGDSRETASGNPIRSSEDEIARPVESLDIYSPSNQERGVSGASSKDPVSLVEQQEAQQDSGLTSRQHVLESSVTDINPSSPKDDSYQMKPADHLFDQAAIQSTSAVEAEQTTYQGNIPNDRSWYCFECGAMNMDWYNVCPVCGQGVNH